MSMMSILQETYDLVQAFQDNFLGGVFFLVFIGLGFMFLAMAFIPALRNAKIMGLIFLFLIVSSFAAAIFVWPEGVEGFVGSFTEDPIKALATAIVAVVGSPLLMFALLIVVVSLGVGLFRARAG
jgi:hypothetical protein